VLERPSPTRFGGSLFASVSLLSFRLGNTVCVDDKARQALLGLVHLSIRHGFCCSIFFIYAWFSFQCIVDGRLIEFVEANLVNDERTEPTSLIMLLRFLSRTFAVYCNTFRHPP